MDSGDGVLAGRFQSMIEQEIGSVCVTETEREGCMTNQETEHWPNVGFYNLLCMRFNFERILLMASVVFLLGLCTKLPT